MRNAFWILICLFTLGSSMYAQSDFFKQPTFSISFFNHSLGIPFKDLSKLPLNIGVTAGVEFSYTDDLIAKHTQRLELGWARHKHLSTSLWIKSDYIRRFTHSSGVFADIRGGLGYIRDFSVNQIFRTNEEGNYQLHKDSGSSGMLMSLGLGTGYRFQVNEIVNVSPFLRYEAMIQTPYSKFQSFLPHSLLHLGTRLQFAK